MGKSRAVRLLYENANEVSRLLVDRGIGAATHRLVESPHYVWALLTLRIYRLRYVASSAVRAWAGAAAHMRPSESLQPGFKL